MPFYICLSQSLKDDKYYIGQTDNIKGRLEEHNNGEVKSTKNRLPFKLISHEIYKDRDKARYREYKLKRHSGCRNSFIRELIKRTEA
jgi:putative endonuclease